MFISIFLILVSRVIFFKTTTNKYIFISNIALMDNVPKIAANVLVHIVVAENSFSKCW